MSGALNKKGKLGLKNAKPFNIIFLLQRFFIDSQTAAMQNIRHSASNATNERLKKKGFSRKLLIGEGQGTSGEHSEESGAMQRCIDS